MGVLASKKVDRKYSINLYGKPTSTYEKRPTVPGQHGQYSRRRSNVYSRILRGRQVVRYYYGLRTKQLKKIYLDGHKKQGNTILNIGQILESMVSTVLYRAGFVPTFYAAKQLVSHGHVMLNGHRINVSSIRLRPGDVLQIKEKSRSIGYVKQGLGEERRECDYINADKNECKVTFLRTPNSLEEIPWESDIDLKFVVEHYSG